MERKEIILTGIALLLEIILGVILYKNGTINQFIKLHTVIIAIIYTINFKYFKDNGGYFDIFIILIPILGFLFLLFHEVNFFSKGLKAEIEKNDLENKSIKEKKILELHESKNLLGAHDSLLVGGVHDKKNMILKAEALNLKIRVEVLKKALKDDDMEVIHYAATELNKLDEKFQNKIKALSKQIEKKEELLKKYREYCESGLLESNILEYYQKKLNNLSREIEEEKCLKSV